MGYAILETISKIESDGQVELTQLVKLDRKHTTIDFDKQQFVDVDKFKFETGWTRLDGDTKVEITRLLSSCDKGHNHGVYYQAPRHMELWEVMFAIGEVNADAVDPHDPKAAN